MASFRFCSGSNSNYDFSSQIMILTDEHHLDLSNSSGNWGGELQSSQSKAMPVGKLPMAH